MLTLTTILVTALGTGRQTGIPFFPQRERRAELELVETRPAGLRAAYLHHRVKHRPGIVSRNPRLPFRRRRQN